MYGLVSGRPDFRRDARMRLTRDSRFNDDELWMASHCPRVVIDAVIDAFAPRTVLDVGCGVGLAIQYMEARGLECVGLEGSSAAIARSPVSHRIRLTDLNRPVELSRRFDLVWSYEVAEHIHPTFTPTFLDTLCRHGDRLVLSAARPGQGGRGHFNEQPQSYWIDLLHQRGFAFDRPRSESLQRLPEEYAGNLMVFGRRD
jgi:SAM-dependent methyltransferase